jgi:hypothetical protein
MTQDALRRRGAVEAGRRNVEQDDMRLEPKDERQDFRAGVARRGQCAAEPAICRGGEKALDGGSALDKQDTNGFV